MTATSETLGTDEAWARVRAVARGGPGASGPGLRVNRDGSWIAEHAPPPRARELLDLYLPLAVREDLVIGQVGQSLDGRVATRSGHSHYVTGPDDLTRLHRVRALVDAVVVGAGTAIADRPRLTVRRVEGPHPARVILDPRGRVAPRGPLFEDPVAPTLWIRRGVPATDPAPHVQVLEPPAADADGVVPPAGIVALLREQGFRRILVEGGGATVSTFLAAGALQRLHVTVAPLLIGSGRHGITLAPVDRLDEALRPPSRQFMLGRDVLFDLVLEDADGS